MTNQHGQQTGATHAKSAAVNPHRHEETSEAAAKREAIEAKREQEAGRWTGFHRMDGPAVAEVHVDRITPLLLRRATHPPTPKPAKFTRNNIQDDPMPKGLTPSQQLAWEKTRDSFAHAMSRLEARKR